MHKEFSAGIVIYRINEQQEREYLLLNYAHGHWDFPKGHLEENESDEEAALRELQEETGLSADIMPGFKEEISYWLTVNEEKIFKTVTFFVGMANTQEVTLSFEHIGYEWLLYDDALKKLTYDNAQGVLQRVEAFLD